jgi:BirA family transcriptional regulator, biotin operon repressor / biotin---[acetyl-CoA-carboxylase] ligase
MDAVQSTSFDLPRLREGVRPFRLHWSARLRSTNDRAAELRRRGELFAPAIVLTSRQTAGRGRGSNTWWSGGGCLTVTFAMPIEEHLAPYQLPLVAGLAVRHAAAELSGDHAIGLKWPNDVVYEGRKLAGLLCERVHRVDLIGVGLNLNLDPLHAPARLRGRLTSLYAITFRHTDPTDALIVLARHLHRTLGRRNEHPFAALLKEYDRHHALVGRQVRVVGASGERTISGQCDGLDDMGRLLLRDGQQLHRVIAGHVELT